MHAHYVAHCPNKQMELRYLKALVSTTGGRTDSMYVCWLSHVFSALCACWASLNNFPVIGKGKEEPGIAVWAMRMACVLWYKTAGYSA